MTAALEERVAQDETSPREPRDAVMQRVRVGLTGLAAVFLLTLLAASILGMFGQGDPHGAHGGGNTIAANAAADQPKEPLAELGVAPGANVPKSSTPAAPPANQPPQRTPVAPATPVASVVRPAPHH